MIRLTPFFAAALAAASTIEFLRGGVLDSQGAFFASTDEEIHAFPPEQLAIGEASGCHEEQGPDPVPTKNRKRVLVVVGIAVIERHEHAVGRQLSSPGARLEDVLEGDGRDVRRR